VVVFKEYKCPVCGYEAWAMDHLLVVKCHICGTTVKTKEIDMNVDHLRKDLKVANS